MDPKTRQRIMQLYCEGGFPDGWAYSIEEIGDIMNVDRKTASVIIREESVRAYQHEEPPAPNTDPSV